MDIVYCPRRHCQYPVTRDPDDNMARCPVCQYAFCVHCKMVYHGIEPCKISSGMRLNLIAIYITNSLLFYSVLNTKSLEFLLYTININLCHVLILLAEKQRLLKEYQSASNEKKAEMEKYYGKKQLQTLIENVMSENWINDNSHNCPHCKTAIEVRDQTYLTDIRLRKNN